MKKGWMIWVLLVLLTGCGAEATFETVADDLMAPVMATPKSVSLRLPEDAAAPVLESDTQQLYMGESYELMVENVPSGDLASTIRSISGYEQDALTVMRTQQGDTDRYEFVWASVGEHGDRLGRAVILDDGEYHYCLWVLQDVDSEENKSVWEDVFSSFTLTEPFIRIG